MAEQTLKEKTATGLFWGGLSNGFQQIWGAVLGIILARILSPADYGLIGMLAIFVAIAGTIQQSGFSEALINKKEIKHEDYNAVFWFNIIVSLFIYLCLFFLAPLIADFYHRPELINLSRFLFLGFVFSSLGTTHNTILLKRQMFKERARIDMLSLVISGLSGLLMALNGYSYWSLVVQSTLYIFIGTILRWFYSPWRPTFSFSFSPLKKIFNFSIKLFLTNIFFQGSIHLFSVLLGRYYTVQQVGYYSQGNKWMSMGSSIIQNMIIGVAQPILVEVKGEKDRQKKIVRKMIRFGSFLSFPLMLGFAFVAKEFISITVGEKWAESVPFLQLLCFWGAVGFLWILYTNVLITHGKSDVYMWGVMGIGLIQIVIVRVLYPYGLFPMLCGYISMYFIGILIWQYFMKKIIGLRFLEVMKDMSLYLLTTFTCFFVTWLIVRDIQNIYWSFTLKVLISFVLYVLFMKYSGSVIFKELIQFLIKKRKENGFS